MRHSPCLMQPMLQKESPDMECDPNTEEDGVGEEVPGAGCQKRGGTTQGSLFPESILKVETVRHVTAGLHLGGQPGLAQGWPLARWGGLKNASPASSADAQWTPVALNTGSLGYLRTDCHSLRPSNHWVLLVTRPWLRVGLALCGPFPCWRPRPSRELRV